MSRSFALSLFAGAVALVSSVAEATETWTWTGEANGEWTNNLNWVNAKGAHPTVEYVPGYGEDIVVFDPGEGNTVSVTNNLKYGWPYNTAIRKFEVRSGTVKIRNGSFLMKPLTASVTSEVYVAENATLEINGYVGHEQSGTDRIVLKTGKGTWIQRKRMGYSGPSGGCPFTFLDVREGIFKRDPDSSWSGSSGYGWKHMSDANTCRVHVWDGAEFQWTSYSSVDNIILDLDKGAVARQSRNGSTTLEAITGEGDHYLLGTGSYPNLTLALRNGSYSFGGTLRCYDISIGYSAVVGNTFTIGSNTLENVSDSLILCSDCLRFAPGIGEFWIRNWDGANYPINLEDTNGAPVTAHLSYSSTAAVAGGVLTGSGNLQSRMVSTADDTIGYTSGTLQLTGEVGSDTGGRLVLGRRDASTDPDFDNLAAIRGNGTVVFNNGAAVAYAKPVTSAGAVIAKGDVALAAYEATVNNASLTADGATLTLTGSSLQRSTTPPAFANGGTLDLNGPGVEISGLKGTSANARNSYHTKLKAPTGTRTTDQTDASLLKIRNGATFYFGGTVAVMPNTEVSDGGRLFILSGYNWRGPESGTRAITLDGGSLEFPACFANFAADFLSSVNTDNMRLYLGEKGGTIGAGDSSRTGRYGSSMEVDFNCAVASAPGNTGTDGGLAVDCGVAFNPTKAWTFAGPVTFGDARFHASKAWYDIAATAGEPFGPGDIVMGRGGWLTFGDAAEAMDIRAASGAGSRLRLKAHGRLSLDAYTGQVKRTGALNLTFGAAGSAAESVLDCGEFGALTLDNATDLAAMHDKFTVRVEGGVPLHADGRTKAPLFYQGGYCTDFLTCDANNFLTNFTGYASDFTGGADSTVLVGKDDKFALETGTTQVGAIKFSQNGTKTKNVTIPEGSTLRIGNGTDPAIVLFQLWTSATTYWPFDGAGNVDFGTSKGWFVYPKKYNSVYTNPVRLTTRISGTGGVVFSGVNDNVSTDSDTGVNADFTLEAANDWTGGTMIDMKTVKVTNKDALSTGPVTVRGSRFAGGSVIFACEGPFANDFDISRFGREYCCYAGGQNIPDSASWNPYSNGALEFACAGTRLTGTVTVSDHSRISSFLPADGAEVAVFEGEVKGARLEIVDMNPTDFTKGSYTLPGKRHKYVFCADNHSLTGGVDIVSGATAVLRGANPSLGTGTIAMADAGTLRFENTAEYTFTNKVEGAGIFQLGSEKEVFLAGDFSELDSGLIDLAGMRHEFSQIPPFPVTNTTGRATLAFKGGLGTVDAGALELQGGGINLEIGAGTFLDLGGGTLTVRRVLGDGKSRVVNGALVETNPVCGTAIIIR